jgi:hypothetical protein
MIGIPRARHASNSTWIAASHLGLFLDPPQCASTANPFCTSITISAVLRGSGACPAEDADAAAEVEVEVEVEAEVEAEAAEAEVELEAAAAAECVSLLSVGLSFLSAAAAAEDDLRFLAGIT